MARSDRTLSMNPAIQSVILMAIVSLLSWGGRVVDYFDPFVLQSPITESWWQLPLSVYAHSSPTHFLANAVVVLFIGGILSIGATWLRFHLFFLITGALSGTLNVVLPGVFGDTVAILGASGAAFGLMGYLLISNRVTARLFGKTSARTAATVFIFFALAFTLLFSGVNVGNLAHFSGLMLGGVGGYFNILRSGRLVPSFR